MTDDAAKLFATDKPVATHLTMPLRFSALRRMGQSPAHYACPQEPESSAIDKGNAADALILGKTAQRVIPYRLTSKRQGKVWDQFAAENDDALILTPKEYDDVMGMVESVRNHAEAMELLTGSIQETLYWTMQGRKCRGTVDVRRPERIVDLKTGETSDPRRFGWKVRDFSYHGAMAWYQDGIELAGLPRPEQAYHVAVEQKAPHVVTVFRFTDHLLSLGRRLYRTWFEHLMVCESSGAFPGYSQSVVDLDLPDDGTDEDGELITLADAGAAE